MPNLPISQLPQSTTLQGNELFVNVQGGVTKYTTLDSIAGHHSAHISLYSTATQSVTSPGVAKAVTFSNVWTNNNITLSESSKIVFAKAGTYQLNFVAQLSNSDNAQHYGYFWIKYNGDNFPNSTTKMSVAARKSDGVPSAQLLTVNILGVAQNDNDFVQLFWTADSTLLTLQADTGTAVYPDIPSIISDVIRIG